MIDSLNPSKSREAKSFMSLLMKGAERLPHATKASLITRYDHIYGDLGGQRSLTDELVQEYLSDPTSINEGTKYNYILALETYFATICNLVSAAAVSGNPTEFLSGLHLLTPADFKSTFSSVVQGDFHQQRGVSHFKNAANLGWFIDCLDTAEIHSALFITSELKRIWRDTNFLTGISDPIQIIHEAIFPKNLMHITGQFYTPPWLARLLIEDSGWTPEKTLIDPFCGSGVFLVCALEHAQKLGYSLKNVFPKIAGVDLNPSAYIAARTNLLLFAAKSGIKDFSSLSINLLCADSLAPAVTMGTKNKSDLLDMNNQNLVIDGEIIDVDPTSFSANEQTYEELSKIGFATNVWLVKEKLNNTGKRQRPAVATAKERKIIEQLAVFLIKKADFVITNPPWVGWEYMSRPYRSYLNPAWTVYNLFEQRGLEASFLKEDLSTLCVAVACDHYLRNLGEAAFVLRPATMKSDMTARGLRRLSVFSDQDHLNLKEIRDLGDIKVFGTASAPAATWYLSKGSETSFPVPVKQWNRKISRWQPNTRDTLENVSENITETLLVCSPIDPDKKSSRWSIGSGQVTEYRQEILGTNNYEPRIGFFTGGANAIFYMNHISKVTANLSQYENITERAKKKAEKVIAPLEHGLIYKALRGRDLLHWKLTPEVWVLCPHTKDTKMYPIPEKTLCAEYPNAYKYLSERKDVLADRNGFAGWEKKIHKDFYYTLQRIGAYTFAPYKVCWSYIASDFIIAVAGPDERGMPLFPNDKVVFIPFDEPEPAYFVAGILSSSPFRSAVVSSISARQISANVIKHYNIPEYDPKDKLHRSISHACKDGHSAMANNDLDLAIACFENIDLLSAQLFGLSKKQISAFREMLQRKLGYFPFKTIRHSSSESIENSTQKRVA